MHAHRSLRHEFPEKFSNRTPQRSSVQKSSGNQTLNSPKIRVAVDFIAHSRRVFKL